MINIIELNERLPYKAGVCYIPMHPSHLHHMRITEDQLPFAKAVSMDAMLEMQARLGLAVTALVHGKPVAMFGCIMLWTGVAEMWSIISDDARRYPKQLTIVAKGFSDIVAQSLSLHRLQLTVRSDEPRALRWAEYLGFEIEGLMRNYSPDGADTYILARV
jgi:ribosomal protein S18 acetylase RimI-like enzyme